MKRVIFAISALLISVGALSAQNSITTRTSAQGLLFNQDIMSVADMGNLSQSSFQYGTARSMAMAGAMTSLGGDASSMMINPAGLGMYRSSELNFTPMVNIQRSDTKGGRSYLNDGAEDLTISNLSMAFNLYESGNSRLISLNMGLGYNKISDFNYEYSFYSADNSSSIANLFSRQMTSDYVELDEVYGNNYPNWNSMPSNIWGAILGYKTGLTDQTNFSSSDSPIWTSSWISPDASTDQYMSVVSDGSIGEYDFSIGANVDNVLYLGFTLGVQRVYQRLDLIYGEEYSNNDMGDSSSLIYSNYNQTVITSGSGVNMKFGATYRPVDSFRLGIAYHTPTWYNLEREYQAAMGSASRSDGDTDYVSAESPILQDFDSNKWKFNSPSRLMIGGSYIIDNCALISVDYQCDWYGSIKTRSLPSGVSNLTYSGISDLYQNVNTLRVGAEYKPLPTVALRGGYGFSTSMIRDGVSMTDLLSTPTTDRIRYYSMGVGYSPSRGVNFDITYMRQLTDYSSYALFYGMGDLDIDGGDDYIPSAQSAQSNRFLTTLKQNNIVLSMTLKM